MLVILGMRLDAYKNMLRSSCTWSDFFRKTYNKNRAMYGSDQAASIETHALKNFSRSVERIVHAIGDGNKNYLIQKKIQELNFHLTTNNFFLFICTIR